MINIIKSKQYFKEYTSHYDIDEPRIHLKIVHTYHVADNARKIAELLKLSKEDIDLAELIGLLHDIGRFDQWKLYKTYSDKLSIDHGTKAVEILFGDKEIRGFIEDEQYDAIIFKAVNNHNKYEIEKGLNDRELLHSKIVRDADNLDIFRACLESKLEDHTHLGSKNVSKEILSEDVFENFKKEKTLLYANSKTDMDHMVAIIAHIFAINFKESLQIIKGNDYINRFVKKINAQDEYTRKKLDEIAEYSMNYIDRKINEKEN